MQVKGHQLSAPGYVKINGAWRRVVSIDPYSSYSMAQVLETNGEFQNYCIDLATSYEYAASLNEVKAHV